jgi:hypothetical protein
MSGGEMRLGGRDGTQDVRAHGLPHIAPMATQPLNAMVMGPAMVQRSKTTRII